MDEHEIELAELRARVDQLETSAAAMRADVLEPLTAVAKLLSEMPDIKSFLHTIETLDAMIDARDQSIVARELVIRDDHGRPVIVLQGSGAAGPGGVCILNPAGRLAAVLSVDPETGGGMFAVRSPGGKGGVSAAIIEGNGSLAVTADDGDTDVLQPTGRVRLGAYPQEPQDDPEPA